MACRPRRRAEQGRKNRQESTNYRFLGVSHSLSLVLVWFGDYIIHHEGTMRFYCVSKAVSVVKKKYSNKERTCNMIVISGAMAACAIFIVVVLISALFGIKMRRIMSRKMVEDVSVALVQSSLLLLYSS